MSRGMNQGRVVLFHVAREIQKLLGSVLNDRIALDPVINTEQLLLDVEQARHPIHAIIIGVQASEPVSIAQRVHFYGRDISIVILNEPDRDEQLKQALQFSPFLGAEVKSWSLEQIDEFPEMLTGIVAGAIKRKRHRGTIKGAQRRLESLQRPAPQLTHYLDRLIDRAPVGVLNTDASGKVLNLNRNACQLLQIDERDAIGATIVELFPEEEREHIDDLIARSVAPLKRHRAEVFNIVFDNGKESFVEITTASLIDKAGQIGCSMILQDVTARVLAERERERVEEDLRKSEAQLRLVTNALPILVSYVGPDHRYKFNNKAYEEWFGVSQAELADGHVADIIGEAAYKSIKPNIEKAQMGEAVTFEMRLPYKGRGERYVRSHMVPDFAKDGAVSGVVTVVSDITDSKQAEEREKQHLRELAHVTRVATMGEMSSQIAHELAQPLTAIANFTDASLRMMRASNTEHSELMESLTDIASMTDRAREVISQLRNFIRKNELQQLPEDVNDLVREVVTLERAETRWHELDVELDLDESLPLVMADKTLIEQVILNLVHNAIEATLTTAEQTKSLRVQTRQANHAIQIAVSDTGPGLAEDFSAQIFEPFYTTKEAGLGMGLAISRSIVDAHGGRIWAENNYPTGATFRFTLAAVAAHN